MSNTVSRSLMELESKTYTKGDIDINSVWIREWYAKPTDFLFSDLRPRRTARSNKGFKRGNPAVFSGYLFSRRNSSQLSIMTSTHFYIPPNVKLDLESKWKSGALSCIHN
uniref:Uncharacterized protein LOC104229972 n=1 Tax=Nicotiana sylvestris TaxID=4096 RepID=A0A1U7X3G1_NICSY|nr:PREDICTED: uncharacterized protein LOC104229972 [Nicotiana sylvestris]